MMCELLICAGSVECLYSCVQAYKFCRLFVQALHMLSFMSLRTQHQRDMLLKGERDGQHTLRIRNVQGTPVHNTS